MSLKSWKVVPFVACLSIAAACATTPEQGTGMEGATTPPASGSMAGTTAKPPMTGAAGMKSAGAAGMTPAAGGAAGMAGAAGPTAVAIIMPFMAAGTSTGAAGASAGAAGMSAAAGTGGQAAKAGTGGSSSGSAGSRSTAGSGGKAGAGGTGTGAGIAAVSGKATFTKVGTTEVDVTIDFMGCEDGKSYPVHIHEGTSCDSVMSQGGHWGAPAMMTMAAASAAGAGGSAASAAGASGSAGHDASHAAGSGGSATGAAGMAAGPVTSFKYRGEGINDIKCTGGMGTTTAKRNSFDKTVLWTIGTMAESDVVGHVIVVHDGAARIACGKIEMK